MNEYGMNDTDCEDRLASIVSNFLLGKDWPNYGDKLSDEDQARRAVTVCASAIVPP